MIVSSFCPLAFMESFHTVEALPQRWNKQKFANLGLVVSSLSFNVSFLCVENNFHWVSSPNNNTIALQRTGKISFLHMNGIM